MDQDKEILRIRLESLFDELEMLRVKCESLEKENETLKRDCDNKEDIITDLLRQVERRSEPSRVPIMSVNMNNEERIARLEAAVEALTKCLPIGYSYVEGPFALNQLSRR
jgi:predicted RNase H-like nuclease (RuvC/YqgF family)